MQITTESGTYEVYGRAEEMIELIVESQSDINEVLHGDIVFDCTWTETHLNGRPRTFHKVKKLKEPYKQS